MRPSPPSRPRIPTSTCSTRPQAYDDYFTKLQTVIAAGQAPDAFELNYENFVSFANKGALADLTPLIAADTGFSTAIYNPTALAAFSQGGKQYGLVESFSNVVLFYNKDLFDKAGVAYPDRRLDLEGRARGRAEADRRERWRLGRFRADPVLGILQDHRPEWRLACSTPTRPRSPSTPPPTSKRCSGWSTR